MTNKNEINQILINVNIIYICIHYNSPIYFRNFINKCWREPKWQLRMDNPETLRMDNPETQATLIENPETQATLRTKDSERRE